MTDEWHEAIVRGLENVSLPAARDITLECAFYGHLYNDGKAGGRKSYVPADLQPGFEQEFFIAIGEAAGEEPAAADPTKVWAPRSVQWAVRRIEKYRMFDRAASVTIGLVKQVARYLRDDSFGKAVRDELARAMETNPRVLVAHSLGSIVAYDWLRRQPSTPVDTLVTIGSPLGFRGIRKALHPDLDTSLPPSPGVSTWVNVAAVEDAVATVKELDGLFGGEVTDRAARNSRLKAHNATAYLQNVHTSNALKAALG
ncbi:lipase family protein [Micromonospora rifamycinica]|uniref:Alpha/beta hydrolase n=1 Tax=Micromonospora rifamycinica TaxID=291594 RepID=A0A109IKZ4_9ACTN|nr:hypothetical protein [Micromonospora rifamycinica]KWV32475.1 hypothetical protein AWV63_12070 [Micromonospora rifamycinica]SCG63259.1 hypothetical protein GA0070623_2976 [Micromonospora rifamycinica]